MLQSLTSHFPPHILEYLKASKTLVNHGATALFHEANQLSLELYKHQDFTNRIAQNIHRIIKNFNHTHSHKLSYKHSRLLDEIKWKHIGRPEMVLNLTKFQFSTTETEALSLGLKFSTGL